MQQPYKESKERYPWVKRQFIISREHDNRIDVAVNKLKSKGIYARKSRIVAAALEKYLKEIM